MRKQGLANQHISFMGGVDNRKVTPGIIELSPARVHNSLPHNLKINVFKSRADSESIDPAACYFDVGSSYPGGAAAAKGGVVRPLKGIVSWVYTVVRQVFCFLVEVCCCLKGRSL